jgi:hypothetical protein
MAWQFTNFGESTLASGISAAATSATVAASEGTLFPSSGDFQLVLVRNSDGAREIVKCTARSGDVLTITRAQEGTTGLILVAGDKVELRITAAILNSYISTLADINQTAASLNSDEHSEAAHATTSDIWNGGQICNLTGSVVTFTDLVNAPQAGAWRIVIPNDAHVFTDNANLEVDGNANYTCAANDVLLISAKTTSTFRVNVISHGDVSRVVLRNFIDGCQMSTAGASTTITIGAGQVTDDANTIMFSIAELDKTTGSWAVGDAAGGLDTGTIAASTWYHFWAIRRSDTGVTDYLFSTSATSPTMPTNYDAKRRIGAVATDASSNWQPFAQNGGFFQIGWDSSGIASQSGTPTLRAINSCPTGVIMRAQLHVLIQEGDSGYAGVEHWDPALGSTNPSDEHGNIEHHSTGGAGGHSTEIWVYTNTSAQIYNKGNGTIGAYGATCIGWYDHRGQEK